MVADTGKNPSVLLAFRAFCSIALAAMLAVLSLSTYAQVESSKGKGLKQFPASGRWAHELVIYRDDRLLGPPVKTTMCTGLLDLQGAPLNDIPKPLASSCTTVRLVDQERLVEIKTTCRVDGGKRVMHVKLRAIDDRTVTTEIRSKSSENSETLVKNKMTYLGPCKGLKR